MGDAAPEPTVPKAKVNPFPLPDSAVVKANAIIRDAKLGYAAVWIIIAWPYFLVRLIQWYRFAARHPILLSGDAGEQADLADRYRAARIPLWFGVISPPIVVIAILCGITISAIRH